MNALANTLNNVLKAANAYTEAGGKGHTFGPSDVVEEGPIRLGPYAQGDVEKGITTKEYLKANQGGQTLGDLIHLPSLHDQISYADAPQFFNGILFRLSWIAQAFTNSFYKAATAPANTPEQMKERDGFALVAKQTGFALHSILNELRTLGVQMDQEPFEDMIAKAVTEWCNGGRFISKDEQVAARAAALGVTVEVARQLMATQSANYSNRMAAMRPTSEVMIPKVLNAFWNLQDYGFEGDWVANEKLAPEVLNDLVWSIIEASGQNILTSWDNAQIYIVRSWFKSHEVELKLPEIKLDENAAKAADRKRAFEQRQAEAARDAAIKALNDFQL